MITEKLGEMVTRLLEQTEAGKVDWEQTAAKGRFQATLGDYALVICEQENADDPETIEYRITVYNGDGEDVECFSDEDLAAVLEVNAARTYRQTMRKIFELARRKAVDAILEVLGDEACKKKITVE